MEIKLLKPGYKNNEEFYKAFLEGSLWEKEYVSEESVWIPIDIPDFPIYFPTNTEVEKHEQEFLTAIRIIDENILNLERDYYMDERFWHSVLCLYKREYLLDKYPEIKENFKKFSNMIVRQFDWGNYIYKSILIAQYVGDERPEDKEHYYRLILDNLDMFNYVIKYEIFRNGSFLINVMDIIEEEGLSQLLKANIKNRSDLGTDKRYGRRVILELNKSYPIIMSPMLEKDELKKYFLKFLSYYTEPDKQEQEPEKKEKKQGEERTILELVQEIEEHPVTMEESFEEPIVGPKEEPIVEVVEDEAIDEVDEEPEEEFIDESIVGPKEEPIVEVVEEEIKQAKSFILLNYEQWLRDNGFLDRVIDQYKVKLDEISMYCEREKGISFYLLNDIEELKKLNAVLPSKYSTTKHKTAMKYYIQFMKENPVVEVDKITEDLNAAGFPLVPINEELSKSILSRFAGWLKDTGCIPYAVDRYLSNLESIDKYCMENLKCNYLSMDEEYIKKINENLPDKYRKSAYRTTMHYYFEFLKANNIER